MNQTERILVLTPVKNGADCVESWSEGLLRLSYPHGRISVAVIESDSDDGSFDVFSRACERLGAHFESARIWKKDFGFRIPPGTPRWAPHVQPRRRSVLAKSRNHLLFHALTDQAWVLWLDVDVVEYPADVVQDLLAVGRDIVHPHCVKAYGGPSFDQNAWRDRGRLHLSDLRGEGDVVELDAVGGTMLLVRADLHRDGLVFPPFPFGRPARKARRDNGGRRRHDWLGAWLGRYRGELETEGFGIMAGEMGHRCYGLPNYEIRHRDA
jgi:hypothetical protein